MTGDDDDGVGLKHKGGGYYDLPDGRSIKGRVQAEQALTVLQLKRALSSGSSYRQEIARRAGIGYKGERDIYTVAGYQSQYGEIPFSYYWSLYDRNEIAGRVVDMPPKTTWKTPPLIQEEGMDPEKPTPFVKEFNDLADRIRLWNRFERGDRLARIGQYGVILIGVPGEDGDLGNEMPQLSGPGDVLYLSQFQEKEATIVSLGSDPADPRFGLPELYDIKMDQQAGSTKTTTTLRVHWSRVIHIAEDLLGNDVYGRPVLKRVINRLFDLDKVTASTAEAFWQLATRILTANVVQNSDMSEAKFTELGEAMQEMIHDLRRQFLGEGVELKWLESTPPDPGEAADLYMMLIAAGAGIPKRILFGTETGERASDEDERQWLGSINERKEQHAEPVILRPFIDRMIDRGALPTPASGSYDVIWPTLFEESEATKAEANKNRAEAAKALTPIGGNPLEIIEVDEDRNIWLKTTRQMEEEGLFDDDDEPPPPPPLPDTGPPEAIEGDEPPPEGTPAEPPIEEEEA